MPPGVCTIRRKLPCAAELGQPAGQAAVRQRAVLRTIVAIHACSVVAGSRLRASRRGHRIVFAAAAGRRLVPAGLGRLHQGEAKFPLGGGRLLGLRRQRRNPAIGRIDDPRRAQPGVLPGYEQRHCRRRRRRVRSRVPRDCPCRPAPSAPYPIRPLCLGEEFLVGPFGGALQRRVGFVGPNALQVGFAPGRLRRRGWRRGGGRRCLRRRPRNGHRNDRADGGRGDGDRYHRAWEPVAHLASCGLQ